MIQPIPRHWRQARAGRPINLLEPCRIPRAGSLPEKGHDHGCQLHGRTAVDGIGRGDRGARPPEPVARTIRESSELSPTGRVEVSGIGGRKSCLLGPLDPESTIDKGVINVIRTEQLAVVISNQDARDQAIEVSRRYGVDDPSDDMGEPFSAVRLCYVVVSTSTY